MGSVFISYSHRDEAWKNRLLQHLKVSLDEDSLEVWDDTRIPVGSQWRDELDRALQEAEIALLLISADFLTSEFLKEEEIPVILKRNQEGTLKLLPVLLRPCAWRTVKWLKDRELFPEGGQALSAGTESQVDLALARLVEVVHQLAEKADGDGQQKTDRITG